ncbi:MAG: alpha/beta hydrolase [Pelagibacteraceae bacterium]|jgi:hypothetical protein|nr:alpha/beta hydrolase [Pelagibacteraceae bacterium]
MIKYIISAFFIYLVFGLIIFLFQRKILFNISGKPNKPEDYELSNIKELKIKTSDGVDLLAWYSKPNINQPMLVYFHGNSFDIGERAYRIKRYINNGWGVLLLAWRGYSGNLGKPTERNLYIDGETAIKWIIDNLNYDYENLIIYGESLGCAVAVELGTRYKFKSIILEAPFTSAPDIARKRYKIYPVKYLVLDKFDNYSKIDKILSPVLIISGTKDEVIPHSHSKKLYLKSNNPKKKSFC